MKGDPCTKCSGTGWIPYVQAVPVPTKDGKWDKEIRSNKDKCFPCNGTGRQIR